MPCRAWLAGARVAQFRSGKPRLRNGPPYERPGDNSPRPILSSLLVRNDYSRRFVLTLDCAPCHLQEGKGGAPVRFPVPSTQEVGSGPDVTRRGSADTVEDTVVAVRGRVNAHTRFLSPAHSLAMMTYIAVRGSSWRRGARGSTPRSDLGVCGAPHQHGGCRWLCWGHVAHNDRRLGT